MNKKEFIKVEDTFDIDGKYLIISPDFKVPEGFKSQSVSVDIEQPDGSQVNLNGLLELAHFKLLSGSSSYSVQLRFVGARKQDIPIGSKLSSDSCIFHELQVAPNKSLNQDATNVAPIS